MAFGFPICQIDRPVGNRPQWNENWCGLRTAHLWHGDARRAGERRGDHWAMKKILSDCSNSDFSARPKAADVLVREGPEDEEDEPKDDEDNNEEDDENDEHDGYSE
jgi:hypothetical protein